MILKYKTNPKRISQDARTPKTFTLSEKSLLQPWGKSVRLRPLKRKWLIEAGEAGVLRGNWEKRKKSAAENL